MNLFETLHDICKPESVKPIIQKIIEEAFIKNFDINAGSIECDVNGRLFIVPMSDHEIKTEYLYFNDDLDPHSEYDYDRIEISTIAEEKDFLEKQFIENINQAEEL